MKNKKEVFYNIKYHLILNIIFLLTVTLSSYIHIPLKDFKDIFFYSVHMCVLQSCFAGILYFLSLNKILFKVAFSFIYLILGTLSFWVYSIDISISSFLIDASFETELGLIKDLISLPLILYVILLLSLLIVILKLYDNLKTKALKISSIVSLMLIALIFIGEKIKPKTFQFKLPYQFFCSFYDYFNRPTHELEDISKINFHSNIDDDIQVTFILGETVRADHLGINGYKRNTTPNLQKNSANIISFKNTYTNKTYTSVSVPQILSNQSIYDVSNKEIRSIYDVLKKSNVNCTWIGNQFLEWSYKPIASGNNKVILIDQLKSYDSYHKLKDEELLPYLQEELALKIKKNMTTLHMIGSHWWYENRYDENFKKYMPVVDSKYFPSSTAEQIINSYDNTILYLDNFLNEVITSHKKLDKPSLIIYISDHGESLGENGKWLHADESPAVTNPAFFIWFSDEFKNRFKNKITNLSESADKDITTDFIYKLILDSFEISEKID